jgi:hypothetical protein
VIPLLMTKTNAQGKFAFSAPTTASQKGVKVYLQAAQAASATIVDLGFAQLMNLY